MGIINNNKELISFFTVVILLVGLAVVGFIIPVKAEEKGSEVEAKKEDMILKLKEVPVEENKINLTGVDLKEAFRNLAAMADLNVVTDDSSVKGRVTAHLKDVSVFKAIEILVKTHGLKYRVVEDTIIIGSEEKLTAGFGEEVTKVFKLNNADPEEVKSNLALMVNGESVKINQRSNKLLIKTYKSKLPVIEEIIKELDQPQKQVTIQVRLEEITEDGLQELGIDWSFGGLEFNTEAESNSSEIAVGNVTLDYESILKLLAESSQSSTLANPHLTAVDGKTATINIGESIPIVKESTENTEVEFKDVGINLEITPRITGKEEIYIEVEPEVSVVKEYLEAQSAKYPVIGTRKAQTSVRIEDGQTIAIGGLIKEEEIEKMSKIPLLGDIPVLGELFKNRTKDNQKQELIIFLTPKIATDKPDKIQN